jgi:serine/threonine protein kinase
VLLTQDGPRVIDFGISQAAWGAGASALTGTGLVVGSPGFMSPEQAEGREVGPPGDVFSLGAVLAFAATGTRTFVQLPAPAAPARTVTSAKLPASGEVIQGQPERHEHRRRRGRLGRPLAIAALAAGLLAESAAGGIAPTASAHQSAGMHSGQAASGQTTSAAPGTPQASAVAPSMSSSVIMSSTPAPSATMSPTASPTPTATPSASMSPAASPSASMSPAMSTTSPAASPSAS